MTLQQIDHLALSCQDPEASKDWYMQILGFEHIYPGLWDGIPIFLQLGCRPSKHWTTTLRCALIGLVLRPLQARKPANKRSREKASPGPFVVWFG